VKIIQANINIKVTEEIKSKLDKIKLHPREPYHETISKLIEIYELLDIIKKNTAKEIESDFDPSEYLEVIKKIYYKL